MLNGKPIVLLDSDDVLGRCAKKMCEEAFKIVGHQYTEEDLRTWDFFDTVRHPEHPTLRKTIEGLMRTKGWCASMEPFPGAKEGVQHLQEIAEVFVITSPFGGDFWEAERREWLYENFGIKSTRVLQGFSKFLVRGELFVDDKPANVRSWTGYGIDNRMPGQGILWDRPHNRDDTECMRIKTWDELHAYAFKEWCD